MKNADVTALLHLFMIMDNLRSRDSPTIAIKTHYNAMNFNFSPAKLKLCHYEKQYFFV